MVIRVGVCIAAMGLAACGPARGDATAGGRGVPDAAQQADAGAPSSAGTPSGEGGVAGGSSEGGAAGGSPEAGGMPNQTSTTLVYPQEPVGAEALTAFGRFPFLLLDAQTRHASSYDRTGGNADYGNALGTDSSGDSILLDARGPGCVYRLWFTAFAAQDTIHVYFDDEPTPRISTPLATLFGGQMDPFTAPLVGDETVSSGGYFSYVPLPFAKSIRITATPNSHEYYNIDYHTYPPDTAVTTWRGIEDLSVARSVWANAGSDPLQDEQGTAEEAQFDLQPKATQVLFDDAGPALLSSIEMRIPGLYPATSDGAVGGGVEQPTSAGPGAGPLNELWMSMSWDQEATPSVLAPIGSLFGLGDLGAGASRGLMAGIRADSTLYLFFPMPFAGHAHVEIVNRGTVGIPGLWTRIRHQPFDFAFDTVGTFAAKYTSGSSTNGADLTLLDTAGSGKLVGVVLTEGRPCNGCALIRDYLEGNERVLIDEARTPVVLGTGTEDFFNGGFYFKNGPFGLPTHGNVVHFAQTTLDATSAYRFFVSDPISFRSHVRISLQHGPADNDDVQASSLVYYYRQQRSRLKMSDTFVVGDPGGEMAHQYALTNQTWGGSFSSTFEGEYDVQPIASTGRAHEGTSRFILLIDPANQGVILRRVLNQYIGDQRGQVVVDGAPVGDWLAAGDNVDHSWREDDFAIPASATAGKSSLTVDVQFVSSKLDWTEYQYEAFSRLP